jgi:hypothetical protein
VELVEWELGMWVMGMGSRIRVEVALVRTTCMFT